jgi:hypothetical protein
LAALGIIHQNVLNESKFAPNGSFEEISEKPLEEDSFELCKNNNIALKSQNSTDISTDSGSDHLEDYLNQSTLEGRRLTIFQSVTQIDEASVCSSNKSAKEDG